MSITVVLAPLGRDEVSGQPWYRCARRRTGVKMAAVPPVTSLFSWCG
jgi:hypothetical protein